MKRLKFSEAIMLFGIIALAVMALTCSGCGGGGGAAAPATTPGGGTIIDSSTPPTEPTPDGTLKRFVTSSTYSAPFIVPGADCDSVWYAINGGTAVRAVSSGNTAGRVNVSMSLVSGLNDFVVICRNSAGKESTYTDWIVRDNTAPTVNITSALLTDGDSVRTAKIRMERNNALLVNINSLGEFQIKNPDAFEKTNYAETAEYTVNFPLSSGSNTVSFRTRDYAGNYSDYQPRTLNGTAINSNGPKPSSSKISVSPTSGTIDTTITANTTCTSSCTDVTYEINWGNDPNNTVYTSSASYKYSTPGLYQITATLTSSSGTNTFTKVVLVRPKTGTDCVRDGHCAENMGESYNSCPADCTSDQTGTDDDSDDDSDDDGDDGDFEASYGTSVSANGLQGPIATNGTDTVYMIGTSGGTTAWLAYKYSSQNNTWSLVRAQKLDSSGDTPGLTFAITNINGITVYSNRAYMSSGNTIYRFSIGDNAISYLGSITNPNLSSPRGMDCDSGTLYVANSGADNILVFNTTSFDLIDTIGESILSDPRDVALVGDSLYVLNRGDDNVRELSTSGTDNGETVGNITTGAGIDSVSINGSEYLVISDEGGREVFGYNPSDNTKEWAIGSSQFSAPQGVTVINGLRKIVAIDTGSSSFKVLDF